MHTRPRVGVFGDAERHHWLDSGHSYPVGDAVFRAVLDKMRRCPSPRAPACEVVPCSRADRVIPGRPVADQTDQPTDAPGGGADDENVGILR